MGKTVPQTDEERLRELVREAHEVLRDLRNEEKQAKTLVKELVAGVIAEEVATQLSQLAEGVQRSIDRAEDRVYDRFDKFTSNLLDILKKEDVPSLEDVIFAHGVTKFIVENATREDAPPLSKKIRIDRLPDDVPPPPGAIKTALIDGNGVKITGLVPDRMPRAQFAIGIEPEEEKTA